MFDFINLKINIMKNFITIILILLSLSCVNSQQIDRREIKKIITKTYPFAKCNSAVMRNAEFKTTKQEKELYDFKKLSMVTRAVIAINELNEILGVSISKENKNKVTVLFSTKYKETPFYKYRRSAGFDNIYNCSTLPEKEVEVTMIKYDTGWRIKK